MKRFAFGLAVVAALALGLHTAPVSAQRQGTARLNLVEATVGDLLKAMQTKLITSEELVRMYLARIAAYDDAGPAVNGFIHINADAIAEARQNDIHRHPGLPRRPLEGIPVALKDIIDTDDMPTTGGSLSLVGSVPPNDAFITSKLRAAGAIIIGKATLTEFANFIAIGMPAGYSSFGLYGFNPYDPRPLPGGDGRPVLTTGGSSSGSGIVVNANLATLAVGTETSGSILSPASANGVVGIKPTVGLVSRDGIIPITADQDTAGPITRTVTDAAILLGVLAGYHSGDPATAGCLEPGNCFDDYTQFLDKNALRGARIAVPPFPANRADIMNNAIAVLRAQGAYVEIIPALPAPPGICVAYPAHACQLLDGADVWTEAGLQRLSRDQAERAGSLTRRRHRVQRRDAWRPEVRPGDLPRGAATRHLAGQRGYGSLPGGPRGRSHDFSRRAERRLQRGGQYLGHRRRLRRAPGVGQQLCGHAGEGGLPQRHGAGRLRAGHRSRDQPVPLGRDVLRAGLQRADADRAWLTRSSRRRSIACRRPAHHRCRRM